MTTPYQPNPWVRIVLPFALGYYLSYLLRTVNAVISPALTSDLQLSPSDLGLLTSAYFLTFAAAQLPLGIALDRLGPRIVEGGLLLLTALGAGFFALGDDLVELSLARGLIGLGVSACLMAGLKGFAMWFPPERQSSMAGYIMAAGAVGALTASAPLEALLPLLGWRGVFWIIAVVSVLVAAHILISVPRDRPASNHETVGEALRSVGRIFGAFTFWRYASVSMFSTGGFLAIQSLWAIPWLMHVNGLELKRAAGYLLLMNFGMLAGQLSIGLFGTRLARSGVTPRKLMQYGFSAALLVQVIVILQWTPLWLLGLLWFLMGMLSAVNGQSYLAAAMHFPKSAFGRVSTAINLMAFIGAFGVQWGLGAVLEGLTNHGWTLPEALPAAFAGLTVVQLAALVLLCLPLPNSQRNPAHE